MADVVSLLLLGVVAGCALVALVVLWKLDAPPQRRPRKS